MPKLVFKSGHAKKAVPFKLRNLQITLEKILESGHATIS